MSSVSEPLSLDTHTAVVVERLIGHISAQLRDGGVFVALGRSADGSDRRVVAATPGCPVEVGSTLRQGDAPWQNQMDLDAVLVPLTDWLHQPLGVLGVVGSTAVLTGPVFQGRLPTYVDLIGLALAQDGVRRYADSLVDRSVSLGSGDFAQVLARSAAEIFRADIGFVARVDPDATHAATLAFWVKDHFEPDFRYPLAGSPCDDVYTDGLCVVRDGVAGRYPQDTALADLGAVSYVGVVLAGTKGASQAHVGVIHRAPLAVHHAELSAFRLLAAQAGVELSRRQAVEQRLELERQLMLSENSKSLGMLAGNIAHDLNNLLVGITGNLGLAERLLPPGSRALRHLQDADATSQRAADLLRQLLAFSGGGRLDVGPTDLNTVVSETTELMGISLDKKIAVRRRLAGGLPAVSADPNEIRQVLINLVLNAAQAIGNVGGVVTIRTHSGGHEAGSAGDSVQFGVQLGVVIEVEDTGCGMSAETQARIFQPYFSTRVDGTGLGLAAVSGVIRGHGGHIEVDSEEGRGSTFRVWLPVATGTDQPVAAQTSNQPSGAAAASAPRPHATMPIVRPMQTSSALVAPKMGGRALVIDDDRTVRRVAASILESVGFAVQQAASGERGLDLVGPGYEPPDIIILDMTMPGMSGVETFNALQLKIPDTPVLLVSGYGHHDTVDTFPGARPAGFLQKPFGVDTLLEKINEVLRG